MKLWRNMMNKRFCFINSLLQKYDIARFELSDCYSKNKEFIDTAKNIFDCKTDYDINLSLILTELVCPEISEKLKSQLCKNLSITIEEGNTTEELYQSRLLLITAMYYNTPFYVYSFNWCYYLECDANNSVHSLNSSWLLCDKEESYIYMAAGGAAIWPYIDNGKPLVIDGIGEIRIRGRKLSKTSCIKVEFKPFESDKVEAIEMDLYTNVDNKEHHIVIDVLESSESEPIKDVSYSKGFSIKNVRYKLK